MKRYDKRRHWPRRLLFFLCLGLTAIHDTLIFINALVSVSGDSLTEEKLVRAGWGYKDRTNQFTAMCVQGTVSILWQERKDSSTADFYYREEHGRNHKVMNELHGKPHDHWKKMLTLPGVRYWRMVMVPKSSFTVKLRVRKTMEETRREQGACLLTSNTMGERTLRWARKPRAAMHAGLLFRSYYIGCGEPPQASGQKTKHMCIFIQMCKFISVRW